MKKFLVIGFVVLFVGGLFSVTLEVTPEEHQRILTALAIYRDLEAGKFDIVEEDRRGRDVYMAVSIAGKMYRFIHTEPMVLPVTPRHFLGIDGGENGFAARYGLRLYGPFGIQIGYDFAGEGSFRAGLFVAFGK